MLRPSLLLFFRTTLLRGMYVHTPARGNLTVIPHVPGGPQPAILQEVSIPVWSNSECKLKYGAAAPGGIVDSFLCAGRAAKDSCSVRISLLLSLRYILQIRLSVLIHISRSARNIATNVIRKIFRFQLYNSIGKIYIFILLSLA